MPKPVRMARVALVAPSASLRAVLARVAASGAVEVDTAPSSQTTPGEAGQRLRAAPRRPEHAALTVAAPDLDDLERAGRYDLLAGEAEIEEYASAAVRRGSVAALAGWMPDDRVDGLAAGLADVGGAVVRLPRPPGAEAPTLLGADHARRPLTPLVEAYGTVPYADIDPTPLAWASYVLMFGMMFGDVGQGAALLLFAAGMYARRPRWLGRFHVGWPFVAGAGVASVAFGFLYGECFGPTGLVPVLWLEPLEEPLTLLAAALAGGAVLLAGAYALGTVNRWREGGWPVALYAPSGIAGTAVFFGVGVGAFGVYVHHDGLLAVGALIAVTGLALAFAGFLAEAGGGGTGAVQASVELFDLVIRLGSNFVSFARLAAFGLTHAALSLIVWEGTTALWQRGGPIPMAAAVLTFVLGNALAFALEALVAAIQAMRLEYYELFSRLFVTQGRPFRPWHLPVCTEEGVPCPPG
ncbi:MAG: V-type ATPase 116kDa subunit family protein [Micromonosporaceae bacterium]